MQISAFSGGYHGQPGDVNGDGLADYVFADELPDGSEDEWGYALVYGQPRGLDVISLSQVPDEVLGVRFAELEMSLPGGDVDADGYSDVLVEVDNWIWVVYGAPDLPGTIRAEDLWCGKVRASRLPSPFYLDGQEQLPPRSASQLLDFNGDGRADAGLWGRANASDLGYYISFAPEP